MPTNKCSVLKRIYAFLIDFVLVLITSLVFEMACSVPLFNVCFSFQDKCNTLIVEQVKTGLYYFIDENFVIVANDENTEEEIILCYQQKKTLYDVKTLVYQKNDLYKSDFYLSSLDKFNYLYDESNFINDAKEKSELFSYIDNQYVFKEDVSEEKRIEFCDEILKNTNKAFNVYKDGKKCGISKGEIISIMTTKEKNECHLAYPTISVKTKDGKVYDLAPYDIVSYKGGKDND